MVSGGETQIISNWGVNHDLDPHEVDSDQAANPADELEDIVFSDVSVERCLELSQGY